MKTSVSSYSFQYLINQGSDNQFTVIQRAKDLGFDAIEFTELTPHDGSTQAEYAVKLCKEAQRCGIEISCYSVGADFLGRDTKEEIERLKQQVDIAVLFGANLMRHDTGFVFPEGTRKYQGFLNVLPKFAEGCRAVTEYAAEKGVRTCTENHGKFSQDSDRVELLINTVAHENFGAQVDMGNFLCADEDPVNAVGRLAPYAFNVHVKDFLKKSGNEFDPGDGFFRSRGGAFLRGTVAGHGVVPLAQCVRALKDVGYDGYLTLEFEGAERLDFALPAGFECVKRLTQI